MRRHGVEYGRQGFLGFALGFLQAPAFGDILVNGDPAALWRRPPRHEHDAPAVQPKGLDRGLGDRAQPLLAKSLCIVTDEDAVGDAMVDQGADGRARLGQLGRDAVHIGIALVADHQTPLGIHHAQAVRHAGQGHVEPAILLPQFFLALLQRLVPAPQIELRHRGTIGGDERCDVAAT